MTNVLCTLSPEQFILTPRSKNCFLDKFSVNDLTLLFITEPHTFNGVSYCNKTSTSGVPRGSTPGPLLFNVYMSSLWSILSKYTISFHIYADDVQLYTAMPLPYPSLISNVLSTISSWCASRPFFLTTRRRNLLLSSLPVFLFPCFHSLSQKTVCNFCVFLDCSL